MAEVAEAALLVVDGLSKRFGRTQALANVSLRVYPGEVHAVLGENGAGKSTLMQLLSGALQPDRGRMQWLGDSYVPDEPAAARRTGVAIVHQEPQLCPDLTVAENILLGVEPARWGWLDRSAQQQRAAAALRQIAGTKIAGTTLVKSLPPGDRQLVAIARVLAQSQCRLLILDEPTSSLSRDDVERLFEAVAKLCSQGIAVLYISHFLEEVERITQRFTVLRDGSSVASGLLAEHAMSDIVRLMVGRDVAEQAEPSQAPPRSSEPIDGPGGRVVLSVARLCGQPYPDECSFELRAGEVLGIAGLVGSGRTELLRALFALDPVISGQVTVTTASQHASSARKATPGERLAQRIGLLSEDRKHEGLAQDLTIADNLTLSKLEGLGPAGWVVPARQREQAQQWIERLRIRCQGPEQPVRDLSGGNQQKVALARLLYHDVDVLLLDEPTRGIDIGSRQEIYALIRQLAEAGKSVLMVSSYLPELMAVCDRIAVMRRGKLGPAHARADVDPHTLLLEASGA